MIFDLAEGTGAIRSGDAIIVGSPEASGEFVMQGATTATLGNDNVQFEIPSGSGIIFRADPSQDFAVGSAITNGLVAAEMYLTDAGWTIGEDVVSFDNLELYTVTASKKEVSVQAIGTNAGKAVVIHVSQPFLDDYATAEDLVVQLDGNELPLGMGMTETLTGGGNDAIYFASKTNTGFDVIVYVPQFSDNIITITNVETNIGVDGLATLLAAIGIVGVAVVALIKTD